MIKTAVMGYGTIGSGVAEILDQNKAEVAKSAGKEVGTMQVQIEVKEKKKDRKRMEQYLERWKKKGGHKHAGC